jgi:hypothetical protein
MPWGRLGGEQAFTLLMLDLGTRWGWVVSVTPRPLFNPGERTPDTHWTEGWVDPRACLDTEVRGKTLSPLPGIEPQSLGRPARSQTLYWLSYLAHIRGTDCYNLEIDLQMAYSMMFAVLFNLYEFWRIWRKWIIIQVKRNACDNFILSACQFILLWYWIIAEHIVLELH